MPEQRTWGSSACGGSMRASSGLDRRSAEGWWPQHSSLARRRGDRNCCPRGCALGPALYERVHQPTYNREGQRAGALRVGTYEQQP